MGFYSFILENRELFKIVYALIIVLICTVIVLRTNKIFIFFRLSFILIITPIIDLFLDLPRKIPYYIFVDENINFTYDSLDYFEEYKEIDFYLFECDCCHNKFDLLQIRVCENEVNIYCDQCF